MKLINYASVFSSNSIDKISNSSIRALETSSVGQRPARDIKSANILLTKDLHCKLADFDMALTVPYAVSNSCGTPGFIAPEMLAFGVCK
jgi:hypothetical protein